MSAIYRTGAHVVVMCCCSLAASFVLAVHPTTAAVARPLKVVEHNKEIVKKWG